MINTKRITIGLLILTILIGVFVFRLNETERKLHWAILQFKLRRLPLLDEKKCLNIRSMITNSPETDISAKFLEQEYPGVLEKSPLLFTGIPKDGYPWSQYRLLKIRGVPGGYVGVEIVESRLIEPHHTRYIPILHEIIYRKSWTGQYIQLERCLKHLG